MFLSYCTFLEGICGYIYTDLPVCFMSTLFCSWGRGNIKIRLLQLEVKLRLSCRSSGWTFVLPGQGSGSETYSLKNDFYLAPHWTWLWRLQFHLPFSDLYSCTFIHILYLHLLFLWLVLYSVWHLLMNYLQRIYFHVYYFDLDVQSSHTGTHCYFQIRVVQ